MKTYAVRLIRRTCIEGVDYPADFQIGAITSEVGTQTLLGLLQFHHAVADEITDEPDGDDDDGQDGSDGAADYQPGGGDPINIGEVSEGDIAGSEGEPSGFVESAGSLDDPLQAGLPADIQSATEEFIAAGVDEKTASALAVANGLQSLAELQSKMADPEFDLIDLEEIGTARAEKIRAIFQNK